jgi:DNA-binding NtrC family response regulator
MNYRILLVDDDIENLKCNKRLLATAGYSVITASSAREAIEIFSKSRSDFALVLMDHHMPGMNGDEAIQAIKNLEPNQQVVVFSMDDTREVMRANFLSGASDFLDKNADNQILLAAVAGYCLKYEEIYRTIRIGNIEPNERIKAIREAGMIGRSDQLYDLCKQTKRIAQSHAAVLINGESGTGKELVAQAIHKMSKRSNAPFVAINIAAESAALLDSTLFGHKKGAFTGATIDHPGKFKQADGGTLFLDEIGDMNIDLQVKLLRVLQEKKINPVGSTREVAIDVRLVCATHKNIEKLVEQGLFREDLYYRINTMIIRTAPLRERTEDIEPLIAQFTAEICQQNGFRKVFNYRCLEIFAQQPWRGNVRELRSVVERHLVDSEVREIGPENLSPNLFTSKLVNSPQTMEEIDLHITGVKRELIRKTLVSSTTKAEAARKLSVAPNRLHYFLEKLGLMDVI